VHPSSTCDIGNLQSLARLQEKLNIIEGTVVPGLN
jgi:hypothetical protein